MFDLYSYLNSRLGEMPQIKKVYRVRDQFKLDELARGIRDVEFPCIAVEVNSDGRLNLLEGINNRSYNTLHVLLQTKDERNPDADDIQRTIDKAFEIGFEVMGMMYFERENEYGEPGACYGLNAEDITYSKIGPVGMQSYGCTFNFVMDRDHESK